MPEVGQDVLWALAWLLSRQDRSARQAPALPVAESTGRPAPAGSDDSCLAELLAEGVAVRQGPRTEGVTTPVLWPREGLGGVRYRYAYPGRPPEVVDCRLLLALVRAAPVLRANGVRTVVFLSHYRPSWGRLRPGAYHYHAQGLALDVSGFELQSGARLWVAEHYEPGLAFSDPEHCLGRPITRRGALLRKIACDLDASGAFQAILTPDYDRAHWNHFHLSAFHPVQRERRTPRGTVLFEVDPRTPPVWAHALPRVRAARARPWDAVAARPWPAALESVRLWAGAAGPAPDAAVADALLAGEAPTDADAPWLGRLATWLLDWAAALPEDLLWSPPEPSVCYTGARRGQAGERSTLGSRVQPCHVDGSESSS